MTRIYIDVCCLMRPFDDQSQARIRLETEAMAHLLRAVEKQTFFWVSSEVLLYELSKGRDEVRKARCITLCQLVSEYVKVDAMLEKRAIEFRSHGIRDMDALHFACAEWGKASVLLTTDDRFIAASRRAQSSVRVLDPVTYEREMFQ